MKRILMIMLLLSLAVPALADSQKPGKGVKVQPARATWNTGYFQEALVRAGLKELGYNAKKPKELSNPLFYQALALGDLDYWTNGWFPVHDSQMPKDFYDKGEKVGYVVKAGVQRFIIVVFPAEAWDPITHTLARTEKSVHAPETREVPKGIHQVLQEFTVLVLDIRMEPVRHQSW